MGLSLSLLAEAHLPGSPEAHVPPPRKVTFRGQGLPRKLMFRGLPRKLRCPDRCSVQRCPQASRLRRHDLTRRSEIPSFWASVVVAGQHFPFRSAKAPKAQSTRISALPSRRSNTASTGITERVLERGLVMAHLPPIACPRLLAVPAPTVRRPWWCATPPCRCAG